MSSATLRASGFAIPYIISDGSHAGSVAALQLGMRLPPSNLSVHDIADGVGHDVAIPTIDVATQGEGPRGMTVGQFAAYWQARGDRGQKQTRKSKLLNCVSLSLAGTPLAEWVEPPQCVRDLDLIAAAWPRARRTVATSDSAPPPPPAPEVLLYALMSPAGSYTDAHIDFGGSSVWYHLLSGTKVFLLAPPTAANLAAFEAWASSPKQARTYLMDSLHGVHRAEVGPGDTLLIPGGWIHCVATPADAIALGGNFVHDLSLRMATCIADLELRLGVPPSARFPGFAHAMWYFAHAAGQNQLGDEGLANNQWRQRSAQAVLRALRAWQEEGPHGIHAPPPDLEHCAEDVITALGATLAATTASSTTDDETAEAEAQLRAAADAGAIGAALTLRGEQAVGTRVCVLRGGRRGERWATGVLQSFDLTHSTFCVKFETRGRRIEKSDAAVESLALHECTLRDPDAAMSDAPGGHALRLVRPPRPKRTCAVPAPTSPDKIAIAPTMAPLSPAGIQWSVGDSVWRYWPADGGWFRAVLAAFDATSGEWQLVYDQGTDVEAFEWADLTDMGPDELRRRRPTAPNKRMKQRSRNEHAAALRVQHDGGSGSSTDKESSSGADEDEDDGIIPATDVHVHRRAVVLPAAARPSKRRGGLGMGAPAARGRSAPPPPQQPPAMAAIAAQAVVPSRATVSNLMRAGLREEALALASATAQQHSSMHAPPPSTASSTHGEPPQPVSPALEQFLAHAAEVVGADGSQINAQQGNTLFTWAAIMKRVLEYVRARNLRHGGATVRCDAQLEALLGKAVVPAAELAVILKRHFGVSANPAQMAIQRQQSAPLPLPPPPAPAPAPPVTFAPQQSHAHMYGQAPMPHRSDWDDLAEWAPPQQQHVQHGGQWTGGQAQQMTLVPPPPQFAQHAHTAPPYMHDVAGQYCHPPQHAGWQLQPHGGGDGAPQREGYMPSSYGGGILPPPPIQHQHQHQWRTPMGPSGHHLWSGPPHMAPMQGVPPPHVGTFQQQYPGMMHPLQQQQQQYPQQMGGPQHGGGIGGIMHQPGLMPMHPPQMQHQQPGGMLPQERQWLPPPPPPPPNWGY